ncbi:DMT family transporter [uncultured Bifidobacterium sp.]|uniref:DMT family transporter n=1 Tax=uncultured Bifidobacterium sp. TaxID=165187 RepID=UPI0028DD3965|nr:DMT family transporter [uncultured Bifidobacterium sp.]
MLLASAAIWGGSYSLSKRALEDIPVQWLLALRMGGAVVLMTAFFGRRLHRGISRRVLLWGSASGAVYYVAFLLQTMGLQGMASGRNAFLTAAYCAVTPFLLWIFRRRAPGVQHIAASVLCLGGVGLVASSQSGGIGAGIPPGVADAITLAGAVAWACYFFSVGTLSISYDPIVLTFIAFASSGVLSLLGAFATESIPSVESLDGGTLACLAALLVVTFLAQLLENIGIAGTPPNEASILLCTETLFALAFSVTFLGERPGFSAMEGFALIFLSIVLSELPHRLHQVQ